MEIRAIKATGLIKEIEIEYIIVKRCMGIDIRKIDRKKVKVDIDLSKINDLTSYDIFLPRKFIGERLDDFLMHDSCDLSQRLCRLPAIFHNCHRSSYADGQKAGSSGHSRLSEAQHRRD